MGGRIGDHVTDHALIACCCGTTALYCETIMDEHGEYCCRACDHVHTLHTLARYGILNK